MYAREKIRIFDYPEFANSLREEIRQITEQIAKENNIEIEFIRFIGGLFMRSLNKFQSVPLFQEVPSSVLETYLAQSGRRKYKKKEHC